MPSPPPSKAMSKPKAPVLKKTDTSELDEERKMGPDLSDPRMKSWPCQGNHTATPGGNQHGRWTFCQKRGLRLSYTPFKTSTSQSTHKDNPANIQKALDLLRYTHKLEVDEMHYKLMVDAVEIVTRTDNLKVGVAKAKMKKTAQADLESSTPLPTSPADSQPSGYAPIRPQSTKVRTPRQSVSPAPTRKRDTLAENIEMLNETEKAELLAMLGKRLNLPNKQPMSMDANLVGTPSEAGSWEAVAMEPRMTGATSSSHQA